MRFNKKIITSSIAALMALTPLVASTMQNANQTQAATTSQTAKNGTIVIRSSGARVYDKNGEQLSTYKGSSKNTYLKAGTVVKYYGSPKYMNKKLTVFYGNDKTHVKNIFYYIGNGGYILGYNVQTLDGKGTLSVYHNAYVYDKNGKRLKKYLGSKSNTLLRKGVAVNYIGKLNEMANTATNMPRYYYFNGTNQYYSDKMLWVNYRTIKGKQYYNIGNGGYVKAANIGYINGQPLYTSEATITLGKPLFYSYGKYYVWNDEGKRTQETFPYHVGQKIKVDRSYVVSDGTLAYRVKGTNKYINGDDVKNKPIQGLRYEKAL